MAERPALLDHAPQCRAPVGGNPVRRELPIMGLTFERSCDLLSERGWVNRGYRYSSGSSQSRQSTSKCPIGSSKPFTAMGPLEEKRMPLPRQRSCTPAETMMQSG